MNAELTPTCSLLTRPFWIFDLDGTLTRPIHDFIAIRRQLGIPSESGILEYIETQPLPRRQRLDAELGRIERALAHRTEANEGVVALLEALKARGTRLAILTRNRSDCVTITLERLGVGHLFETDCLLGCEDAPPKPDPAGIHQLLAHWSADPQQCLIVGDYRFDLEAGTRAGIGRVHFQDDPERHWPQLTDLKITHFDQLTRVLSILPPLPAEPASPAP